MHVERTARQGNIRRSRIRNRSGGTGPANDTSHYTDEQSARAQISFRGTQFTLTYVKGSNRGSIDVWVDGESQGTIDAHSSTTEWQQTWTSPLLTQGVHTVQFIHAGGGTYIDIDAIQIVDTTPPSSVVSIEYFYDPLYRLTDANYSKVNDPLFQSYHYEYDTVGNRKKQTTVVQGQSSEVTYEYDDANRLTSVNNVPYSWDANGNLLDDGVNTYTYDYENHLKSITGPSPTVSYEYNGLGDRLQETTNGQTTIFTMDLNMGLTQALSDGTNDYIYGVDRVAQVNSGTEYFLGDALGSVRQLTDGGGVLTYAAAYDPYGVPTQNYGASQTAYGYTNEYTSQGLVYLRARYYVPSIGRFLSRDEWDGNPIHPISFNGWNYTKSNPINLTDPSGWLTPDEEIKANEIVEPLAKTYNVIIPKDWGWGWGMHYDINPCNDIPFATKIIGWTAGAWRNLHELELARDAIARMATYLGGTGKFKSAMKGYPVTIHRVSSDTILGSGAYSLNNVLLPNNVFDSTEDWAKGQITHELAHVWDLRFGLQLSAGMKYATKSYQHVCGYADGVVICTDFYDARVAIEQAPTNYAETNARDDWAESFKVYIYPSLADPGRALGSIRKGYIQKVIRDLP